MLKEEQMRLLSGRILIPLETSVEPSEPAIQDYVNSLDRRDVNGVLSYYYNGQDTLVEWGGKAGAYAGKYQGYGNIRILFATLIGNTGFSQTIIKTSTKEGVGDVVSIRAELERRGVSRLAGKFKMVIGIDQTWRKFGNSWRIIHDLWNFKSVDLQNIAEGGF